MYFKGLGTSPDRELALNWLEKAAARGNVDARSALGYLYHVGHGVSGDHAEAARWYRMAAGQGCSCGQSLWLRRLTRCAGQTPPSSSLMRVVNVYDSRAFERWRRLRI